jgi:hypothetical protein
MVSSYFNEGLLPVDDVLLVKGIEGQEYLGRVKIASKSDLSYCYSLNLSLRDRRPKSSPPGQYSRTKYSFLSSWKHSLSLTRKGWLS